MLGAALLVILVGAAVGASCWMKTTTESRRVRKAPGDAPRAAIANLVDGRVARLIGEVHATETLEAPLSARTFDPAGPREEALLARDGKASKGWYLHRRLTYKEAIIPGRRRARSARCARRSIHRMTPRRASGARCARSRNE
jgi:hypothetical protein